MQSSSVTTPQVPLPRSAVALATTTTSAASEPPRHDFPDLTTTVPRQYVHRAAVSEVFLTNWETDGSDGFIVAAQWPRGHALFAPRRGQQDPMLIAETIRQVGMMLAHAHYGVPLDHHFLIWDISYNTTPGALTTDPAPTEVILRVRCHDLSFRGKQLSSIGCRVEVWRGNTRIAVGNAGGNCVSPAVYARIRNGRPLVLSVPLPEPLDPEAVGRHDSDDVVLTDPAAVDPPGREAGRAGVTDLADCAANRSGAGRPSARRRWLLRVNTTHPVLFDHPIDHVPGMLLVEAARQAAQALLGPCPVQPIAMEATFERFAELNVPCWIEAENERTDAAGNTVVSIVGQQNGEAVFTATVTTRPLA